jgi:hypothetical protein
MNDAVAQRDLDRLKGDLEYEINKLRVEVEELGQRLKDEMEERRDVCSRLWERLDDKN